MGWFDDLKAFGRKAVGVARSFGRKVGRGLRYGAKKVGGFLKSAKQVTSGLRKVPIVGSALSPVLEVADTAIRYGQKGTRIAEGVGSGVERASDAKSLADLGKAVADVGGSIRRS